MTNKSRRIMERTFSILLLIIFVIYGCKDDNGVSPNNNSMETPTINAKDFYSGEWRFNGIDSTGEQKYYEFKLNLKFRKGNNNSFPKVLNGKDSVEINAASLRFGSIAYYGDSLGIESGSFSLFLQDYTFLDSLIFFEEGMEKSYTLKLSQEELNQFPLENEDGTLYASLWLLVDGGYITDETDYDIIKNKLLYGTSKRTLFVLLNKKLINSKFGLNN